MLNNQRLLSWLPLAMAGTLVVGGAALNFRSWRNIGTELKKSQAELSLMKSSNEGIKKAMQSTPELMKIQDQFRIEAPRESKMGALLESISAKLTELKVGGEEVITEPTKAGPKYTREQVTLRFRGNSGQAHEVLKHLRDAERLIRVDRVKMEQAQDGGSPTVEIQFSAFTRPMEEAAAWLETR